MKKIFLPLLIVLMFSTAGAVPVYAFVSPASTSTPPSDTVGTGSTDNSTAFVPLTNIPLIDQAGNASTFPNFLNQLYKICIGLAAVLAVLQIIRAGIMYMGGDSVTEKSAARSLIVQSLLGLLLVLSPVIVFSIINPSILSLQIGNLDKLALPVSSGGNGGGAPGAGGPSGNAPAASCSSVEIDGYAVLAANQSCQAKYGGNGNTGIVSVDVTCCDNSGTPEAGAVCCAHPKTP